MSAALAARASASEHAAQPRSRYACAWHAAHLTNLEPLAVVCTVWRACAQAESKNSKADDCALDGAHRDPPRLQPKVHVGEAPAVRTRSVVSIEKCWGAHGKCTHTARRAAPPSTANRTVCTAWQFGERGNAHRMTPTNMPASTARRESCGGAVKWTSRSGRRGEPWIAASLQRPKPEDEASPSDVGDSV